MVIISGVHGAYKAGRMHGWWETVGVGGGNRDPKTPRGIPSSSHIIGVGSNSCLGGPNQVIESNNSSGSLKQGSGGL